MLDIILNLKTISTFIRLVKAIHVQAWIGPLSFQEVQAPKF